MLTYFMRNLDPFRLDRNETEHQHLQHLGCTSRSVKGHARARGDIGLLGNFVPKDFVLRVRHHL